MEAQRLKELNACLEQLAVVNEKAISAAGKESSSEEKAKAAVYLAFSLATTYRAALKTMIDAPREHGIDAELKQISGYLARVNGSSSSSSSSSRSSSSNGGGSSSSSQDSRRVLQNLSALVTIDRKGESMSTERVSFKQKGGKGGGKGGGGGGGGGEGEEGGEHEEDNIGNKKKKNKNKKNKNKKDKGREREVDSPPSNPNKKQRN